MNDILSIIGTVASVGSVPLSIYLFIKSKENNIDKTKREIVRILSHQIGDRRELTSFEIQTVINSNSRTNKINSNKISINEIVEDLVSDTISNPLLDTDIKEGILTELKNVYTKSKLLGSIDRLEKETRNTDEKNKSDEDIAKEIKEILFQRKKEQINNLQRKTKRSSELFAITATIATLITVITSLIGKQNYDENFAKPVYDFFKQNDFYISIIGGIIVSILAGSILALKSKLKK